MAGFTVGLALSGGGASGLGHIPVLEALDDLGIRPKAISGTSIGALVGVCYAAGMTGVEIRDHVVRLTEEPMRTARKFFEHRPSPVGNFLFQIDAEAAARAVLPASVPAGFEQLEIPLTVAATDFYGRKSVYLNTGAIPPAIAGSMAIPGVFRPVPLGDQLLIDGGVTDNLPLRSLPDCDLCIAVDVATDPNGQTQEEPDTTTLVVESLNIMMGQMLNEQLKQRPDALRILPTSNGAKALEFHKTAEILERAAPTRAEARETIDAALKRLRR